MSAKTFTRVVFLLLAAGTLHRLLPILMGQPALSERFVTEDGYLMLTVARNIAIGLGMSVSDGTIPTNGVQPLATFLFAVPYLLTGGNKVTGLIGIHLISAAVALATAFAVRAFARRVFIALGESRPHWPWIVALLWFLGPILVRHSMNALETGLITLMVLLSLLQLARVLEDDGGATPGGRWLLGALCGVTFLARNDAVFLGVAIFLVWGLHCLFVNRVGLVVTLQRTVPPGLLCLAIAVPWVIHNSVRFGSIVPISGAAQSMDVTIGSNAHLVPIKLLEHLLPMLPVPSGLEESTLSIVVASVALAIVSVWFSRLLWNRGGAMGLVVTAYAIHATALITYYGLFFGAQHFLSRYLAPLAPLLILAATVVLVDLSRRNAGRWASGLAHWASGASIGLCAMLLIYLWGPGAFSQGHFQVVRWVEENVPATTWVGAVQTGTLGYWHDRTINLDGKVNLEALEALHERRGVLPYVVQSKIDYLADWAALAGWAEMTDGEFNRHFRLLHVDHERDLAVIVRVSAD